MDEWILIDFKVKGKERGPELVDEKDSLQKRYFDQIRNTLRKKTLLKLTSNDELWSYLWNFEYIEVACVSQAMMKWAPNRYGLNTVQLKTIARPSRSMVEYLVSARVSFRYWKAIGWSKPSCSCKRTPLIAIKEASVAKIKVLEKLGAESTGFLVSDNFNEIKAFSLSSLHKIFPCLALRRRSVNLAAKSD